MTTSLRYWNRINPIVSVQNIEQHLSARVRDPLWILSRQWQLGEFQGEDAGSPAFVSFSVASAPFGTWSLPWVVPAPGVKGAFPLPTDRPIEQVFEQEADNIYSLGARVEQADILETMLEDAGASSAIEKLRSAYSIPPGGSLTVDTDAGSTVVAPPVEARDQEGLRFLRICAGRVLDVWALLFAVDKATMAAYPGKTAEEISKLDPALPSVPGAVPAVANLGLTTAERTSFKVAFKSFVAWLKAHYHIDERPTPGWLSDRLEYRARVFANSPIKVAPSTWPMVHNASSYSLRVTPDADGSVDWSAFDIDRSLTLAATTGATAALTPGAYDATLSTVKSFPAHVRFRGMPNERWWDFESNEADYGSIMPERRDLAKLLVADFMLSQGNDWFTIPFEVKTGSINFPQSLWVYDVFGDIVEVLPASTTMFQSSAFTTGPWGAPVEFISPPSVGPMVQESDPIEEVHFLRDNVADMVWGIEAKTPNALGGAWNGYERAQAGVPTPPEKKASASAEAPRPADVPLEYLIETTVPENWIPLVPVAVSPVAGGKNLRVMLQRSAMERVVTDGTTNPDGTPHTAVQKVQPFGAILRSMDANHRVAEAEVPREGLTMTRSYKRARWIDGSTHIWLTTERSTGLGEARSGLAFDQALPKKS
jgi:hypothetical protein